MATIVADSASRTNVLAAYNTADPGDTVSIPTGSATWSSTITISKAITIQGAGGTSTVLTSSIGSGGSVLTVELASDLAVRITGIGFLLGTMNNGRQAIRVFGDRTGGYALTQIRIDNNPVTGGGVRGNIPRRMDQRSDRSQCVLEQLQSD